MEFKEEVDRVKYLYRPVIDLDNGGVRIEPNFEEADKALENLVIKHNQNGNMKTLKERWIDALAILATIAVVGLLTLGIISVIDNYIVDTFTTKPEPKEELPSFNIVLKKDGKILHEIQSSKQYIEINLD